MTSQDPDDAGQPPADPVTSPGPAKAGAQQPEPGQTGRVAETGRDETDPALLLVRAINTLPPEQRDQVLAWLLSRGPAVQGSMPLRLREMSGQLLALQRAGAASSTTQMTAGQQVVPVRFPVDQHAQLRTWCAEHGFSMATVIRGLVSRFLDGQLPERN